MRKVSLKTYLVILLINIMLLSSISSTVFAEEQIKKTTTVASEVNEAN
ncbi:hypothetical protein [Clostridium sp.]